LSFDGDGLRLGAYHGERQNNAITLRAADPMLCFLLPLSSDLNEPRASLEAGGARQRQNGGCGVASVSIA
jgi:hypothetical protein